MLGVLFGVWGGVVCVVCWFDVFDVFVCLCLCVCVFGVLCGCLCV